MQYAGFVPNRVTMINALHACAHYGNVEMWAWIRGVIKREGWELDMEKNVFTWNAVIKGLALAKSGQEAIWWFNRTEKDGVKADEVTLLAVLTACSHSGLVDKGREIFGLLVDGRYGGDLELALLAARKLIELEPDNTAYYIHLSNLYAVMGRWSDVEKERGLMKDRQLTKDSGCSSVEVEHQSHVSELLA
ncbi:putative pentatricopeptide repeat-containing protein [Glycine max]|nr:putative pentatricopeptide repeat-containing protein [Glycine max]